MRPKPSPQPVWAFISFLEVFLFAEFFFVALAPPVLSVDSICYESAGLGFYTIAWMRFFVARWRRESNRWHFHFWMVVIMLSPFWLVGLGSEMATLALKVL